MARTQYYSITKYLKLNDISGCQLKQILLNFVTMKASGYTFNILCILTFWNGLCCWVLCCL